jgi:hypothetical protein
MRMSARTLRIEFFDGAVGSWTRNWRELEECPVNQTLRNSLVTGTFGLACVAASGGCAEEPLGEFNGFGNTGNTTAGTTSNTGGSAAGSFNTTAGTPSTAGGTPSGTAGTFGTSGTPATGGSATAAAGGAAGGAGGSAGGATAGSGGAAAGAGGTGQIGDFPANCPAPTGAHTGAAFTRTCFSITASSCAASTGNMDNPAKAIDGMDGTRWSTGATMASSQQFTFTVDLGSEVMVTGVSTTSTSNPNDQSLDTPPQIQVATSTDGVAFTPVACGSSGATDIDIGFAAKPAKFVRLVQHGIKTDNWWTIKELNVYGTGTTCAAGTGTHTCTVSVQ